ncbi:MAG TPA: DsbC family protein [Burkholderiales bacterium]|nr:DsbC family protein [Burkholderiales bacterium]
MARSLVVVLGMLLALAAAPLRADEAGVKAAFEKKFPQATVESVKRTPFAGIYEIVFMFTDQKIAYADEKLNFIFIGDMIDVRGSDRLNLTEGRRGELASKTLQESTALAIKRVRGNGKRVLYTFEDPNCSYCRKLQQELVKMTDITIYTFLWPILSPDSVEKSKAVWCAKDRGKAWDDLMTSGTVPQNDRKCENPLAKNNELARRFGVRGTPAIYLKDGRQVGGYVAAEKLEEALLAASSK